MEKSSFHFRFDVKHLPKKKRTVTHTFAWFRKMLFIVLGCYFYGSLKWVIFHSFVECFTTSTMSLLIKITMLTTTIKTAMHSKLNAEIFIYFKCQCHCGAVDTVCDFFVNVDDAKWEATMRKVIFARIIGFHWFNHSK